MEEELFYIPMYDLWRFGSIKSLQIAHESLRNSFQITWQSLANHLQITVNHLQIALESLQIILAI